MKRELKVSTGTIYHHLDTLSPLIEQKTDKKYYLTELGTHAYNSLRDNISTITTPDFTAREFKSPLLKALMKLTPRKIILNQEEKKYQILLSFILSITIGSVFSGLNHFFSVFLFFYKINNIVPSSELISQFLFSVVFIVNFLIYFLILEGICRIFYKKHENTLKFLKAFGMTFVPLNCYLVIHFFLEISQSLNIAAVSILDNIFMILFQVWSLWILTYNISVNKQLKIESSLIIVLLIHYTGFSIFLLLSI